MVRGGQETFLMNVMRRIDRERCRFIFCTPTTEPCDYDEEILSLGGEIVPCVFGRSVSRFHELFRQVLERGGYDVVHAHNYTFAGVVVRAARRFGIRHRFAHLHTTGDGQRTTLPRMLYRKLTVHLVRTHATRVLACSRGAFDAFFGSGRWEQDGRMNVVYYGVDLPPFEGPVDRQGVRRELGVSPDDRLMIHVGRFIEAKNHGGLVDIFREVRTRRTDIHLVLVGEGELMEQTRARVAQYGLQDGVHFVGVRSDVPRLMKAADVMVMPSVREGMPVTMIEATAAGLPIVITDMPGMREANEVCCRATLLPVTEPAARWADVVIEALDGPRPDFAESLERVRNSPLNSNYAAEHLMRVYEETAGADRR